MFVLTKIKEILIGKPLNALNPKTKEHIALIAIFAWIGLGADGLSSSSYGPEEAFLALGQHTGIGIFLAFATALTVFLIALSYNQIIELFPNGGGGYKVATHLLGERAGVVSGAALIVDYILTIAVSTASGVDAIFSLLPTGYLPYKEIVAIAAIVILMILNLRGIKESIIILLPLFIGFLITHVLIIFFGIWFHRHGLVNIIPNAKDEFSLMSGNIGILATLAIFLKAYSMGGGTYTGLEAVSNNINILAEPRVKTGKLTMLYMAISLSFTAGSIILLYLLWHATPIYGQTLNAVVFSKIIAFVHLPPSLLIILLFFEASLLFVGANTGFLGCPAVMSNMAVDKWLPRQFKEISNRLVTQNGILISGIAAIFILIWADNKVSTLVVLYSINVFLTFSLSLLGLSVYWIKARHQEALWWRKLILSTIGFLICSFILFITLVEKFQEGGWLTILITTLIIIFCVFVKNHYKDVGKRLNKIDIIFANHLNDNINDKQELLDITNKEAKTAVFFVNKHYGAGLHALLWVRRLFPEVFINFIFLTTGEIDADIVSNGTIFKTEYRQDLHKTIEKYRLFCTTHHLASNGLFSYGVHETEELIKLANFVEQDYPNCVFFASKLVFVDENWWSRLLHNNTLNILQRRLHLEGKQMVILPMKIDS